MLVTHGHPVVSANAPAVETLGSRFGSDGAVTVASAPGRVNLVGGHTDYNDGFVLPVAIDRRTVVAAASRADGRLRVYSRDFDEQVDISLAGPTADHDGWSAYVAGVVAAMDARGLEPAGASLVVDGDVPMGAGLSSSAALEVAVAGALAGVAGLDLGAETLATVCWTAETEFVGVDCGIMDQFAVSLADPETALFLDCRTRASERLPVSDAAIVVTDTTVQHDLVDSAYGERVRQCEAATDTEIDALRDVTPAMLDEYGSALDPTVRRRCRHVVTENERVRRAAEGLRRGDLVTVGRCLDESHASLRDDYDVSCPELDAVVERAATLDGVYGSRMTGAGFGGSVVSLVAPERAATVAERLADPYPSLDVVPDSYVCRPAGGLAVSTGLE